ncbi:unnamed protein product [Cuscuta europaea]|uniref:Cyclin N-terminal domain-containing protein n=1 Tax=Cuscuta europaea TaxID=41803 RepID=A0A9P1EEM0_CUSEU|nr:unnamed protein product [Cuscuta europaea]
MAAAGADGRNRRALGDIGNLVTIRGGAEGGKVKIPQVSRPLTRGFCAQLLANAQANADNKNKKSMSVNLDQGEFPARIPRKPHLKKPSIPTSNPPKPEEVIVISPGTADQKDKKKFPKKSSSDDGSSYKTSYTSTLTARSKAACGLKSIKKPNVFIQDIDAGDEYNELAVVEYVEDIYKYYKEAENENRVGDYMKSQPEINERMRAILVDWLTEVHHKFELTSETLYLTFNIVDRYLASKATARKDLQLVGISAMLIASKYEEIWAPEVNDFVCISDRAYTHEQVLQMEKLILGELEWYLTVPTPYVFLVRFIKASSGAIPDSEMENMVYFLAELGMMNYAAAVIHCPSMIAASAVYAARCALNRTPSWNDTLRVHTGFSEGQLMGCAKLLVGYHLEAATHKLRVIFKKYSLPQRDAVAILPPAKSLLAPAAAT